MLPQVDTTAELESLYEQVLKAGKSIGEELESIGEPHILDAGSDLSGLPSPGYVYLSSGYPSVMDGNLVVRLYNPGDFFLLSRSNNVVETRITSEFASEVIWFSREALLEKVLSNPPLFHRWQDLQDSQRQLLDAICAFTAESQPTPNVQFVSYEPGAVIIQQGTEPNAIYELLSGTASIWCDDVQVNTIAEDEIFGEMSFLTESPRSATVKAETFCEVQVTSKSDFEELVRARPSVVIEIACQLARRVAMMDDKLSKV